MDRYKCELSQETLDKLHHCAGEATPAFVRHEVIDFVFRSNHLEKEGTLDDGETAEICNAILDRSSIEAKDPKRKVTMNTLKTLQYMYTIRNDNASCDPIAPIENSALSEDQIETMHNILMSGLEVRRGYRVCDAKPVGYDFYYEKPDNIPTRMMQFIDTYNEVILYRKPRFGPDLFKYAAWALFEFVDIHPFSDGNGRLCRIIATHVLQSYIGFPVVFHCSREHYIQCIQEARTWQDLTAMTTMLIESVHFQHKKLRNLLQDTHIGYVFYKEGYTKDSRIIEYYNKLAHHKRTAAFPGELEALMLFVKSKNKGQHMYHFNDGASCKVTIG